MRLNKVLTILSITVVVVVLAMPASAQKGANSKLQDPYDLAALEGDATRVAVENTAIGTLIRYKDQAPAQVDAATSFNWQLHNYDLNNGRYAALDQINISNVKSMVPAWIASLTVAQPSARGFQTTPVVVDGVMYITGQASTVVEALDAVTGTRIWTFQINPGLISDSDTNQKQNRGVAYGDGAIYMGAGPLVLAFDAKTGQPLQTFGNKGASDVVFQLLKARYPDIKAPIEKGYQFTAAPQYYKGMVITVAGYSELNNPGGLVIAVDAKTGKLIWSFNTIPQGPTDQGWEISKNTWSGDRQGGGVWGTPAIEPETGTLYYSIANPYLSGFQEAPGKLRTGINLFTDCMVAMDLATGKLKWYYQQTHHDLWDFDSASPVILYDMKVGGKTIKAVAEASKNGLLYVLNRATGKPIYPILEQPVPTATPRAATGETVWPTQPHPYSANGQLVATVPLTPTEVPDDLLQYVTPPWAVPAPNQITSPGLRGGVNFAPTSQSPQTGMLYTSALHVIQNTVPNTTGRIPSRGIVSAFDANTLDLVWRTVIPSPTQNGTVVTSGNLVFVGDAAGFFYALDARTGEILWKFYTGSGIAAAPMTYMVNGKQYVSIASGGAVYGTRFGSTITTFALFGQ